MTAPQLSRRRLSAAAGRRRAAFQLAFLATSLAALTPDGWADEPPPPTVAAASLAHPADDACRTVWFRDGAKVQMEADGAMPMSRHTVQQRPLASGNACSVLLQFHSKTAMAALMGPPVVTDQQYAVVIVPPQDGTPGKIEGGAVIDASGRYARLHGATHSIGTGVFDYANQDLREGAVLGGESVSSRLKLTILERESGNEVGTLEAPQATIKVASRSVGKRQIIDTALGSMDCVPIRYDRETNIGPLEVAGEAIPTQPTVMHVIDWYCPTQGFVMRSDVEENGKVQRIDTTSIEALDTVDAP